MGHAERSGDLRKFIEDGKKIIISTVQKFPFILDEIGNEHRERQFAIIIDEAHSSQGGKTAAAMSKALCRAAGADETTTRRRTEDTDQPHHRSAARCCRTPATSPSPRRPRTRRWRSSASRVEPRARSKHRPFHSYTMKQAIQEGFILDVLKSYTPVDSYYKLVKTVEDDPEFDTKKAQKKLRRYVESHDHAIRLKAEIMVDHFHEQVLAPEQDRRAGAGDGGDRAASSGRSSTSTPSTTYLQERKSPYQAIVAFSGEHEYGGAKVTEASLNGFPSKQHRREDLRRTRTAS